MIKIKDKQSQGWKPKTWALQRCSGIYPVKYTYMVSEILLVLSLSTCAGARAHTHTHIVIDKKL